MQLPADPSLPRSYIVQNMEIKPTQSINEESKYREAVNVSDF